MKHKLSAKQRSAAAIKAAVDFVRAYPIGIEEKAKLLLGHWPTGRGRKPNAMNVRKRRGG